MIACDPPRDAARGQYKKGACLHFRIGKFHIRVRKVTALHCYIVRSAVSLGILGIFWAETVERLWWLVDQANADPSLCEYAELTSGFLAFTGEDEPIAAPLDNGEAGRFIWSRAEPSEALVEALHRPSTIAWKRLPQAGEPGSGLFLRAVHDKGPGSAGRS